jgi:hypothetical protein
MMKRSLFVAVALGVLGISVYSYGAAPNGVKFTVHNLSAAGPANRPWQAVNTGGVSTEICIFCHTPHNAVPGRQFLWNRNNEVSAFNYYTASPTLGPTAKGVSNLGVESRMCMSCHDGATALNSMANPQNISMVGGADELGDVWPTFGDYGPNIGEIGTGSLGSQTGVSGNLTNDHPVSFSYTAAQSEDTVGLKDMGAANGPLANGLVFWGTNNNLECVTCHDPHINYGMSAGSRNYTDTDPTYGGDRNYAPFLRRPNSSSGLCFSCHDK